MRDSEGIMQTLDVESSESQHRNLSSQQGAKDGFSLLELLIVLTRRKRFIATITLLMTVAAIAACIFLPNNYTAVTSVLPPQQNSSLGSALLSQVSQLGNLSALTSLAGNNLGLKNPSDLYVAMLHTRSVEDAVIQRFGLQSEYHTRRLSDARRAFENHFQVQANSKTGLIEISVQDRDPNRAAELANGYVEEFRRFSGTLAITEASQRRVFFEQQLLDAKENLAKAEEALKRTQQKTGLVQLDAQARAMMESAASLRAQVAAKEVQIRSMGSFATDDNPQMVVARQQLAALQDQLHQLTGNGSIDDTDLFVPKGKVPEAGLEYIRAFRDVKYYETIFEILARQLEVARLDEARQGALIQVFDKAVPPDRKSFPKPTWIIPGAIIVALTLSTFWVLFIDAISRLTRDQESQERLQLLRKQLRVGSGTLAAQNASGPKFPDEAGPIS
jgi:uncharacterized protein involved in exopolysaccharide biosynthesis